jgi:ubiquinone/menaquinone biosynthesis C-methylase UbiE
MLNEESHIDLINKDEYFKFLDKKLKEENISLCQYKAFKRYYELKEYEYDNSSSNKMISTCFKLMKRDNKKYLYVRFYILLIHFLSANAANKLIDKINNNPSLSDREIINYITNLNKNSLSANLHKNNLNKNSFLCNEKEYFYTLLFNNFIKIISNPEYNKHNNKFKLIYNKLLHKKNTNLKYLDVGCGNGKKTKLISSIFKINHNNVYCADVPSWGPYQLKLTKQFYKNHFQPINPNNGILNFPNDTFDFVSIILTMHHIPNLTQCLNEIKRVTRKNGIILIIEHDALTKYDHLLIEIQHMLYGYTYDKKNPDWKNYIENRTTNRYMNVMEWRFLFKKFKFEYLYGNMVSNDISHNLPFDNQFYGFYKNEKSSS